MKYLLRFNKETNKFIDMQTVNEKYIYKYYEVEELAEKEGLYVSYEYDKEQDKIVGKYIEIPKTSEDKIKELEEAFYAMQEQMLENLN